MEAVPPREASGYWMPAFAGDDTPVEPLITWVSTCLALDSMGKSGRPAILNCTAAFPHPYGRGGSPQAGGAAVGVHDEPVASQKRDLQVGAIAVQALHRDSDH